MSEYVLYKSGIRPNVTFGVNIYFIDQDPVRLRDNDLSLLARQVAETHPLGKEESFKKMEPIPGVRTRKDPIPVSDGELSDFRQFYSDYAGKKHGS